VNGIKNIIIDVFVSCSNQDSALKLELVLLSPLLLDNLLALLVLRLVLAISCAISVNIFNTLSILIMMSA
jgi:hypothetical protein